MIAKTNVYKTALKEAIREDHLEFFDLLAIAMQIWIS